MSNLRPAAPAAIPSPELWAMALLAVTAPTLIAPHDPPSVTFYNQALAVLGWGVFIAYAARLASPARWVSAARPLRALQAALGIIGAAAAWSSTMGHLPGGLGMMGCGMSLAAIVALEAGWRHGQHANADTVAEVFFGALATAGAIGMVLAMIQVFHPGWADGILVAAPTMVGRAVGNLRQPNHFSTMMVFAACGAGWLGARRRLDGWLSAALVAAFIGIVVLTASRTGMVGMVFLSLWGLFDKRMPRLVRWTLMGAPVVYGLFWGGMWLWAHADKSVAFAAEARLHDGSDISSSRFAIWANVLEMIRQQPWTGVGYGEFNVAWTLTPFPTRPVAFFDHTHNVVLQWAVELGVPAALLLCLLCGWGFVALARGLLQNDTEGQPSKHRSTIGAASAMVAMAGLHSLLEYPLWYSYFLLPTAFAWGLGLSVLAAARAGLPAEPVTPSQGNSPSPLLACGIIMATAAVWCAADYQAAANIYAPRPGAGALDKRIAFGQGMPWWGYQADYADVTIGDDDEPAKPPQDFRRTLHNLLDVRLMIAYARSLAESGEVDKARFVVARMKEFKNTLGTRFLDECKAPQEDGDEAPPFQCAPPEKAYTWRELLPQ